MYGTFGQKCLISGTHIRDTFSSEACFGKGSKSKIVENLVPSKKNEEGPQKVRKNDHTQTE